MEITTNAKTLFYFPNYKTEKLELFDSRNILFYSSDFSNNFKGYFYLPKGKFTTDNQIKKSNKSLQQPKIKLPKRQRDYKHNFKEFKIFFGENKHKCSIFHNDKIILFDSSFLKEPQYIIDFILYHEHGHNYYSSEELADLFSVAKMIKKGYNPSQIINCPFSLSDKQEKRKIKILEIFNNFYNDKK